MIGLHRLEWHRERSRLGLPLSDGFVKLHGGTLALKSQPGVGTRAIVTLPAGRVI